MPRRPRHFRRDSIFHAGCRGVDRQPIFLTDGDREFFVATMEANLRRSNLRTVAWSLMPNHFHWGIATADELFDKAMHDTLTAHAVRFNRLHGRTGHLFEQRHWSFLCEDIEHVENMVAYIHMNPVKAGIVKHPRDWKWSSYSEWDGGTSKLVDFDRLLELTGRRPETLQRSHGDRIAMELSGQRRGLSVDALIDDTASMLGVSPASIRSGSRGDVHATVKRMLIARAERENISLNALARGLGCTAEALYMLRKRS